MSDPTLGHDLPTDAELRSLYDAVGWTTYTDDLDRLARGLRASLRVVTARVDGALAGLARVVGDGETIARSATSARAGCARSSASVDRGRRQEPGVKRRRRVEFDTTNTLDRLIAKPAMSGLSSPNAASGIAAML